ncbi:MAG TPA: formylglycine-generating enzyme family protein [Candidatus Poseidoniaceae archaeon]|nr:formylglycine-generating enzyme family protein [Candidatus Poseidoniaceae archaeon]
MAENRPFFDDEFGGRYLLVEPGTFLMGAEKGTRSELPTHQVTISEPFFCGERPVTQAHWQSVMATNPSTFSDGWAAGLRPVEQVSWLDVHEFLSVLNLRNHDTEHLGFKGIWRLPTEAEWEYLARAGTLTRWAFGNRDSELNDYGWHAGNSGASTREVGQKKPNPWGFFDLHGQVSEWCEDIFVSNYEKHEGNQTPMKGSSQRRVHRGGSWFTESDSTRCSSRGSALENLRSDGIGFRLVWQPL